MSEINTMSIPAGFKSHLESLDKYISYYKTARRAEPPRAVVANSFYDAIVKSFGKRKPESITRGGVAVIPVSAAIN